MIINFSSMLCDSEVKVITSKTFEYVLAQYMRYARLHQDSVLIELKGVNSKMVVKTFQLLLLYRYEDIEKSHTHLDALLSKRDLFYRFTENFYDYWRNLERYGILLGDKRFSGGYKSNELIHLSDAFNANILSLYRSVAEKIRGDSYLVYRQLPAGINSSLMIYPHKFSNHPLYEKLQGFHFIQKTLIRPPFMIYSKANRRVGIFNETLENPLKTIMLNRNDYMVYPIWVGSLLAFVYIHIDYLHHGVALSNLFQLAAYQEYVSRKPDLIMIYGSDEHESNLHYYKDLSQSIYIGIVSLDASYDYFGYLKKMLLTLHNVHMLDHQHLPIHGSMVNILLQDGREKNVIVVGDSGAGKSETLEALRTLGSRHIVNMRTVFDDMGVLVIENNQIFARGTETGAFVRLDDLESGYAYREIDRAVFLNPDQTNARVVLPISPYKFINKNHKVDLFLYANNYEENKLGLKLFDQINEALKVFKQGKRYAKGTTAEVGLVESFFANPFGPVQQQEQANLLIDQYLSKLFNDHIDIGVLFTELGIVGREKSGPRNASDKLLSYIINN